MALTQDQIMMLAQLGGQLGATMGEYYENPFAVGAGNFAQQMVAARNLAKLLQEPKVQPPAEEKPEEEKEEETSEMDRGITGIGGMWELPAPRAPTIGGNYMLPSPEELDVRTMSLLPGVDFRSDADNNITMTRKFPAQVQARTGTTPTTALRPGGFNPFLWPS